MTTRTQTVTPGERPNFRRLMVLTGLAAVTASLLAFPAYALDKTAEVDRIFSWITPGMPGCTVAVSHQGQQVVSKADGLAEVEGKIPLTTKSVLDAGSVVKQFVAASVLLLVEDKRLSLSEDIRNSCRSIATLSSFAG